VFLIPCIYYRATFLYWSSCLQSLTYC